MSNRDLRTEPRLMNVIQNELQPACRALDFDADAFAKAETVFIDRAAVSRTFDYMGKHDIRPEWYDLLPDNLFVGTGLPVLVRVEGEYLGRLTGNRITAKPFTADMEAYWLCKENLKKTDGTRGNGTALRFGRCPGLREASRYNERLFRDGEYNHPTPVGYGAEAASPFHGVHKEARRCYRGMAQARTPLAPFVFLEHKSHETGLDTVVNHCPYLTPSATIRILREMDTFPQKREVDKFMLAFTMTAFALANNQTDVPERYETIEVGPPKAESKRQSDRTKTTLLIRPKPAEPAKETTPIQSDTNEGTGGNSITGRIETITPDIAKEMLGENTNNRKISHQQVELFARTMAQQAWKLNGEAIKFSNTGRLLDGQHRLLACVESGVPFRTLVIRGLPEDTQATMDAGKTRTMANVLELQGRRNPALLATTATAVCVCEQVGLESACLNAEKPTRNEVVSFIDTHPEMNELAKRSASFYTKSGHLLSRLLYSLLWWTFNEIDSDDCRKFFDMLITGANLEAGSPVLALRNTLFEINRRGVHSDYMSRRRIAGLTVEAWNRWRDGENVKQLRFASSEPFPTAH